MKRTAWWWETPTWADTIGLILSEIIDACENGHDHDRNPVEVKLRNIDFKLNTGLFSRNRDIIEGSSFCVLG